MKLAISTKKNGPTSQLTVQQSIQKPERNEQRVIDIPNEKPANDNL